jgi:hypothetical protein
MSARNVAPFLQKLWEILEDKQHADIVCWAESGETFEVKVPSLFSTVVLPKYFKHGKFSSFQRQLNYFGFRKIGKSASHKDEPCCYSHEHFRNGRPDEISKIRRKTNHRDAGDKAQESSNSGKPSEYLHEGYLQIQNYKAWSGWSKKYFVLEGAAVKWYTGQKMSSNEEGRADINADTKTYMQEGVAEPRIMYVMTNGRSLVLRAASQQEMMTWLNAFKNNISAMRHVQHVKPEAHRAAVNALVVNPTPSDHPAAQWQYTQDHLQMLMDVDMADDQQSFPGTPRAGETRRDTRAGPSDSFDLLSGTVGGVQKGVGHSFDSIGLGDRTREAPSHSFDISVSSSVLSRNGVKNAFDAGSVSGLSAMEMDDRGSQADNMSQNSDGLSGLSDISDLSDHLRRTALTALDDVFNPLPMAPPESPRTQQQQQQHHHHHQQQQQQQQPTHAFALPLTPKQQQYQQQPQQHCQQYQQQFQHQRFQLDKSGAMPSQVEKLAPRIEEPQPQKLATENAVEFGERKANFWRRMGGTFRRQRKKQKSSSSNDEVVTEQPFPLVCQDGVFKHDQNLATISQAEFYGQTQAALAALSASPATVSVWEHAAFAPCSALPVAIPLIKCDSTDSQGSALPVALPITHPNGIAEIKMEHQGGVHNSTLVRGNAQPSLDSIMAEQDGSDTSSPRGRGGYKCGKCGQPKAGHICPFGEENVMMRSASTQCDLNVTASPPPTSFEF